MRSRIDVSLLTAESREIYIGEHIVGRRAMPPIGDRAYRGGTGIIVIAVDKPRVQRRRDSITRERGV